MTFLALGRLLFILYPGDLGSIGQLASAASLDIRSDHQCTHWWGRTLKLLLPYSLWLHGLLHLPGDGGALGFEGRTFELTWDRRIIIQIEAIQLQTHVRCVRQTRMRCVEADVRDVQVLGHVHRLALSPVPQLAV